MWSDTVREKIRELEAIATWASMTNFGGVRDYCRLASSALKFELERAVEIERATVKN